jgi:hypothetical protein
MSPAQPYMAFPGETTARQTDPRSQAYPSSVYCDPNPPIASYQSRYPYPFASGVDMGYDYRWPYPPMWDQGLAAGSHAWYGSAMGTPYARMDYIAPARHDAGPSEVERGAFQWRR